jgi:hypothetical protein
MAKRREFELDELRAVRARGDAVREQNRKLFLEVAEFAQSFDSRLTAYEDPFGVHSRVRAPGRGQAVAGVGSQGLPASAVWMASMARMPWLAAETR